MSAAIPTGSVPAADISPMPMDSPERPGPRRRSSPARHRRIRLAPGPRLRDLGLFGLEPIEPAVLAALATEAPLLLIGPHGTAKTLLLERISAALGLVWRHYNASLLNYDDLVGYPLPDADGHLRFIQTEASIWPAEAVFLDEISRCRPDMQNRLFSLIHERRVQGVPLPQLAYRWAAMNPPLTDDAPDATGGYLGSEPLDPALADRFYFIIPVPTWAALSDADRAAVICSQPAPIPPETAAAFRDLLADIRAELPIVTEAYGPAVLEYVRLLTASLATLGLSFSGRRAAMLYRNVLAVHAAAVRLQPTPTMADSAWLALEASIPQRAQGQTLDRPRILLAHNEAWKLAGLDRLDPRRLLCSEPDPVRRALRALAVPALSVTELSAHVADGLAEAPPGGRHALAAHVLASPAAGQLTAAVAEQVADLAALLHVAQSVQENVRVSEPRYKAWQEVVRVLGTLPADTAEQTLLTNLLIGLFTQGALTRGEDVPPVVESWRTITTLCQGGAA